MVGDPPGSLRAGTRLDRLAPDLAFYVDAGYEKPVLTCFERRP